MAGLNQIPLDLLSLAMRLTKMKKAWIHLRLLVAEKLLSMAMSTAPKDTNEGKDIMVMVIGYCKKHSANMRLF